MLLSNCSSKHFCGALKTGPPYSHPLHDALLAERVVIAAVESLGTGIAVTL